MKIKGIGLEEKNKKAFTRKYDLGCCNVDENNTDSQIKALILKPPNTTKNPKLYDTLYPQTSHFLKVCHVFALM